MVRLAFLSLLFLAAAFFSPEAFSKTLQGPEVWFELMGGNVRKDGIRCDLEAIAKAGFSGVHFFHIGGRGEDGVDRAGVWPGCEEQIHCMSEKWWGVVSFIGDECKRLGLELTVQNCPGWSQSGGPWISLDNCQRDIECARADFAGGERFALPSVPERFADRDSDWRDVCVLAFPTPLGDECGEWPHRPVSISTNGYERTYVFSSPVTVRSLKLPPPKLANPALAYNAPWRKVSLEVKRSNVWEKVLSSPVPTSNWRDYVYPLTLACDEAAGRQWRFRIEADHPILDLGECAFLECARHTDWEGKSSRTLRSLACSSKPRQDPRSHVALSSIVDITGKSDWAVPRGRWTVLRIGHVNSKHVNSPAPKEATGWECDKLDPKGIEANFGGYILRLLNGPLKGKMKGMLVDSWECFGQTWTPKMEEYFKKESGYELRKWIPALFGYVVGSSEATEKFLTDWRRTNGNLITKNYFGRMSQLAHAAGLKVYYETAFGDIVHGDLLEYWKYSDAPMCEFWYPHASKAEGGVGSYAYKAVAPCASAAHVYGKKRVIAEAFTGKGIRWNEDFRRLQDVANRYFARGVTHLAFQSYTHAPQPDATPPGGCMGGFNGTPFTRLQTWWKHMPEFTRWLRRCEEFLEAGVPAQDVLWYLGDAMDHKPDENYPFPEGFKADYLNHDVLTNTLRVANGLFTIPGGASWRVLWVPDSRYMLPATRKALERLASQGGKVVWGGKEELKKALSGCRKDVATDIPLGDEPSEDFMWIHRKVDGYDRYFVAAGTNGYRGKVTFRSNGPVSIFDPVSCVRTPWKNSGILEIPPSRSIFVEFGVEAFAQPTKGNVKEFGIKGFALNFKSGFGAKERVLLEDPVSWTEIPCFSAQARAYSGPVVYESSFELDLGGQASVILDLGTVESVAEVFVNGQKVRTLWCEPFSCDITAFVRTGVNQLRVDVVNTWRNRIIYDLSQPEKDRKTWILYQKQYNPGPNDPLGPAGILGPVKIKVRQ